MNSNQIDESSLFIILFSFSDPTDVNKISKIISQTSLTDIYTCKEYRAQIWYCGKIFPDAFNEKIKNDAIFEYQIKIKKLNANNSNQLKLKSKN